jgi:hypothetical protein
MGVGGMGVLVGTVGCGVGSLAINGSHASSRSATTVGPGVHVAGAEPGGPLGASGLSAVATLVGSGGGAADSEHAARKRSSGMVSNKRE